MKTFLTIFISCFVFCGSLNAQSISGNLTLLANQKIELEIKNINIYNVLATLAVIKELSLNDLIKIILQNKLYTCRTLKINIIFT